MFKFSGEWYEIARNPMIVLSSTKCDKISLNYNNNVFSMKSTSIMRSFNKDVTFEAVAYQQNGTAKMTIHYPLTLFSNSSSYFTSSLFFSLFKIFVSFFVAHRNKSNNSVLVRRVLTILKNFKFSKEHTNSNYIRFKGSVYRLLRDGNNLVVFGVFEAAASGVFLALFASAISEQLKAK